MKLKRCFIDEIGNIWRDKTLIESSKDLPIIQFDTESISLDEEIRWKITNLRDYVTLYQRVFNCDLSVPIILRSDGYPMDGWHRIIKARFQNERFIPARKFEIDPEPDFKVGEK